jgi:hypothetical protein
MKIINYLLFYFVIDMRLQIALRLIYFSQSNTISFNINLMEKLVNISKINSLTFLRQLVNISKINSLKFLRQLVNIS